MPTKLLQPRRATARQPIRSPSAQAAGFAASVDVAAGRVTVSLGGELDLFSRERCRRYLEEIAAGTEGALVVDLSLLSFIDCAGVVMLAELARQLSDGRPVSFVIPPHGSIRRTLDLLRLINGELCPPIREAPRSTASRAAAKLPGAPRAGAERSRAGRSPVAIPATE